VANTRKTLNFLRDLKKKKKFVLNDEPFEVMGKGQNNSNY